MSKLWPALFGNYIKTALRTSLRFRIYSAINIGGLMIGMVSVFCIALYLYQQWGFDRYHANSEVIYRTNGIFTRPNRVIRYPLLPPALGPALTDQFPSIKHVTRLRYAYEVLMKREAEVFYEDKVFFAEPSFLEMFEFKPRLGNAIEALAQPGTIVLTSKLATKYFGEEDPIDQIIRYNNELDLRVGAVIGDVPENTHLKYDCLISFGTYEPGPGSLADLTSWRWLGFITYIMVEEKADVSKLASGLAQLYRDNSTVNPNRKIDIQLQPLKDIYLGSGNLSNPMGGLFRVNSPTYLLSLAIVALLIIIIAFFNYLNTLTALTRTRTKELAVRKVLGASAAQVARQLTLESCLTVLFAGVVSAVLVFVFSHLKWITISWSMVMLLLILIGSLCLGFGLLAGLFMSARLAKRSVIYLFNYRTASLRDSFTGGNLVLLIQYAICAMMVASSLIVVRQLDFFREKELGYHTDDVLVLPFRGQQLDVKREPLRNALLASNAIEAVSFGPSLDGSSSGNAIRLSGWTDEQFVQTSYFGIDYDFPKLIDLDLVEGRSFSREITTDSVQGIMVNETLAAALGLSQPVGERVTFIGDRVFEVIGVFSDFHYQSLHHEIGPLALIINTTPSRNLLIRLSPGGALDKLAALKQIWNRILPNQEIPLQYTYLTDQITEKYGSEQAMAMLIRLFAFLAILVTIIGLFGLTAISIQTNQKQFSIKRILGARGHDILYDIGRNYLRIAILASLIATPITWYLLDRWLESFAYRIDIQIWFFLITVLLVVTITLSTIAILMLRLLRTAPASNLRN